MSSIPERLEACRGLAVHDIGHLLADLDQDATTRQLMRLFGERTAPERLPALPFTVRHTLYGEDDVSEWALMHHGDGFEVVQAGVEEADEHVRWEHWEDAVRVINGDVSAFALLFSRRVWIDGVEATPRLPAWFRAASLAPDSEPARHALLLSGLAEAFEDSAKARSAFVAGHGLAPLAAAGVFVVAQALVELGATEELEGSYLRITVPAEERVVVQVDFAPVTASPTVRRLASEAEGGGPEAGVTLHYASSDAFIAVSSGETRFEQLLVNGLIRVGGNDHRREQFGTALLRLAEVQGSLGPG